MPPMPSMPTTLVPVSSPITTCLRPLKDAWSRCARTFPAQVVPVMLKWLTTRQKGRLREGSGAGHPTMKALQVQFGQRLATHIANCSLQVQELKAQPLFLEQGLAQQGDAR